jgi:hypothetical protein
VRPDVSEEAGEMRGPRGKIPLGGPGPNFFIKPVTLTPETLNSGEIAENRERSRILQGTVEIDPLP